jgi:hypothetical protein
MQRLVGGRGMVLALLPLLRLLARLGDGSA